MKTEWNERKGNEKMLILKVLVYPFTLLFALQQKQLTHIKINVTQEEALRLYQASYYCL